MADLMNLAHLCEVYDPSKSRDNRADEMPIELAIAKAMGVAPEDAIVGIGYCFFSPGGMVTVPRYLTSLDAAMSLEIDGYAINIEATGFGGAAYASAWHDLPSYDGMASNEARAPKLAQAITATWLRAHARLMLAERAKA